MSPRFTYTTGDPSHLVGGQPAAMIDIQGPFNDLATFLNGSYFNPIDTAVAPVSVLSAARVGEVGDFGGVRAGHQLTAADFTSMGLSAPAGLWNLGDLTDASGNGRALTNKGGVPFGTGINGVATTSAVFAGSTAQALYITDTGAADPFRIRTGSWGCWMRTAKRTAGAQQHLLSKWAGAGAATSSFLLYAYTSQVAGINISDGTSTPSALGTTDVCDDRWHFIVGTCDASRLRLYVDGALEAQTAVALPMNAGASGPLNVGASIADGSTSTGAPHYGRVDEAFVTADVLTEDQIRLLYAARPVHTLGAVPGGVRLAVRRKRRGAALATTDFPSTPVRLHNFTAGALTDQGTGGITLTANVGTGTITDVGGADGTVAGAKSFAGVTAGCSSTDAGLPAGTAARSHGAWFKTTVLAGGGQGVIGWGTISTGDTRVWTFTDGTVRSSNAADALIGPVAVDGQWHHVVMVEDNAAADGVKRKMYLDGRCVAGSTVLNSITLAGANRFRVGATEDGSSPWTGQIDGVFVYAGALTSDQVRTLYNVSGQQLAASPKDATDHVEALNSADIAVVLDTIEATDLVDCSVTT